MTIEYSKQSVKTIQRLDVMTKQRIKRGIEGMPKGDIKKLQGHAALYRLRVGDWRVVFSYINGETILIERIAPRGDVYKEV